HGNSLKSGDTIPVQNTAPDVDPDEILSAFDTDTRSYLQLLINGAGKGLKGHGTDLNKTFKALGPTYRDLAKVSKAIAARRAAINLAEASPDIAKSFHELNRFFNMGAYNPNGREPVTGNPVTDANRDEGYLFWLAWVGQNTTSLFSTSDAQGPLRRFIAFFNCT